jgi:hypothetical protein
MGVTRKPVNYIDNALFLASIENYIEKREKAKAENLPPPRVPEDIGAAFLQIATRLSTRYNFNGYSFKDDMISAGTLNALEAIDSFKPDKSKNPFSYFTQVIFWAFIRVIKKEKGERETRDALMFDDYEGFSTQDGDSFNINKDDLFLFYNSD